MNRVKDGFMLGLGLWLATVIVGTAWFLVMLLIAAAVML
ncbi:hypothetical protein ES703_102371 [subsurface metagenome]